MDDPVDITPDGSPSGKAPKEVRFSYVMADPEAGWKAALAEAKLAVVQRMAERFTTAMREENLAEETVQRVLNRVLNGHPDGLEHWSREVERATVQLDGRFIDTEKGSS